LLSFATTMFFACSEEEKIVNLDTVIKGKITNTDGNVDWLESFKNQRTQTIAAANGEFDIKSALTQATCFDLANGSAINFDKTS
jgi:hypothetical protein